MTFKIDGQERLFNGSIGPYSSDNLGAHSLGGFQESFSGLRICRICMATRADTVTKVLTYILFVLFVVCSSQILLFIRNLMVIVSV